MKRPLTLLAALLFAISAIHGQTEKRVLFIGNSYTDVNNLPNMVSTIAADLSDRLTYQSNTPGGCTFSQHCQNQSMTLIRQGGWDAVVLQEQSQYPAFPDGQVMNEVFPYAQQLVDSIYANSPCAEPMFYMTWGRKYGDEINGAIFPPISTYEGMDSLLALRYRMMADQNDAALCPVGRVWHYLRDNYPEIELYQSDNSHPSVAGTYAAACSFYTLLFLHNPEDIHYNAELEPDVAATIRAAVRTIVFDSLSQWQRPQPEIEIILADTLSYMSASFSLSTTYADSVSISWGDGTDTLFPASDQLNLHHLYTAEGTYEILIRVCRHCMTTERGFTYTAQQEPDNPVGINTPKTPKANGMTIYPNPATHKVHITLSQAPQTLDLLDLQGRLIHSFRPSLNQTNSKTNTYTISLNLPHLSSGTYLLRAHTPSGPITSPLLITTK